MAEINYITIEEAKAIHQATIENSGGGDYGELDTGKLESVLFHIQNDDYYPTFLDKLEHLFFCACKFHCFADGNKRIAITLTAMFLLKNGYMAVANVYFREMENISYHVAAGHIDEELLKQAINNVVKQNDSFRIHVIQEKNDVRQYIADYEKFNIDVEYINNESEVKQIEKSGKTLEQFYLDTIGEKLEDK